MTELDEKKLAKRLEKARVDGNMDNIGKACRKLGDYLSRDCRYEEALTMYTEELSAWEQLGSLLEVACANRMIGEMHNMLGKYEESLKFSQKYLEYAKKVNNKVEEQRALATIAVSYFLWANDSPKNSAIFQIVVAKCKKANQKSLSVCENEFHDLANSEKNEMMARVFYNSGLVLELEENYDSAHYHYNKVIKMCKEENIFELLCKCYTTQGNLYFKLENVVAAHASFDSALEIAKNLSKYIPETISVLMLKAEVYFFSSNYISAKNVLKKAYKLKSNELEKSNAAVDVNRVVPYLKCALKMCLIEEKLTSTHKDHFIVRKGLYEQLGDLCCAVKNYKQGIQCYLNMLDCAEKAGEYDTLLLPCYTSLAQTYKDDKQYDLALAYYEKSLNLESPQDAVKSHLNIGEILELKKAPYSEIYYAFWKAKDLAIDTKNIKMQISAVKSMARIQLNFSKIDLAKETERQLKKLIEENGFDSPEDESDEDELEDLVGDITIEDVLSDSEQEIEEFDRPRVRNPRNLFKVKRNEKGETQLHLAAIRGDVNRVKVLIEQGHPVKEQDLNGWTPLHEACNHGHVAVVDVLLDGGANINDPGGRGCEGLTPLHDAASCGHLEVVDLLVKRGASVGVLTNRGETPLDYLKDWRKRVKLNLHEEFDYKRFLEMLKPSLKKITLKKPNTESEDGPLLPYDNCPLSKQMRKSSLGCTQTSSSKNLRSRGVCELEYENTRIDDGLVERNSSPGSYNEKCNDNIERNSEKKSAEEEYRSAMETVRKRPGPKQSNKNFEKTNSALLNEEDFVDDWLEDDLGTFQQPQKKRKTVNDLIAHDTVIPNKPVDTFAIPESDVEPETIEIPDTPSPRKKILKKPKQPTLLKTAFVEHENPEITTEEKIIEPMHLHPVPQPILPPLIFPKVRVKVENHILLISIPKNEELTIRWLIDEASERYNSLEGIKPVLRLKTKDGAVVSENDPLSLVFGEEMVAVVMKWKVPSIENRYKDAFIQLSQIDGDSPSQKPDDHIITCLEMCKATKCLNLEYLALTPYELAPIFTALKHEPSLKILNLSGNILGDEGLCELCKCLEKCTIEEINLSCNNISSSGAQFFIDFIKKQKPDTFDHLLKIDFSFNPFGITSSLLLRETVVKVMKNLVSVNINDCE